MSRVIRAGAAARRRLQSAFTKGIHFLAEGTDWVIDREGETLRRNLDGKVPFRIDTSPRGLRSQVVHFGSLWSMVANIDRTHPSNRVVLTLYHGHEGLGPEMAAAIAVLKQNVVRIEAAVTACRSMGRRLEAWGIPPKRVHVIPLGVDTSVFRPATAPERAEARRSLGIPDDAFCVGSFQKDGVGWGDGSEPKLIKGPDRFVHVMKTTARKRRVHAHLLGPARGYVKRGLSAAGISLTHATPPFAEVPSHYHALDAYLVTSREEGGPRSILEAMASGIPLVSTDVGMAPDVLQHGTNGIVVSNGDESRTLHALAEGVERLAAESELRRSIVANARRTVESFGEADLARRHLEEVYLPLMNGSAK